MGTGCLVQQGRPPQAPPTFTSDRSRGPGGGRALHRSGFISEMVIMLVVQFTGEKAWISVDMFTISVL